MMDNSAIASNNSLGANLFNAIVNAPNLALAVSAINGVTTAVIASSVNNITTQMNEIEAQIREDIESERGDVGATGAVGAAGATGAVGDTGVPGDIGAIGVTGAPKTGVVGARGVTGAAGTTGAEGVTGASARITGVTGAHGVTGADGVTGAKGVTGASLRGETGAFGVTGATGTTGAFGVTGATGSVRGETGATGTTGADGVTGARGMTGIVAGATGETGAVGTTGAAGATGRYDIRDIIPFEEDVYYNGYWEGDTSLLQGYSYPSLPNHAQIVKSYVAIFNTISHKGMSVNDDLTFNTTTNSSTFTWYEISYTYKCNIYAGIDATIEIYRNNAGTIVNLASHPLYVDGNYHSNYGILIKARSMTTQPAFFILCKGSGTTPASTLTDNVIVEYFSVSVSKIAQTTL